MTKRLSCLPKSAPRSEWRNYYPARSNAVETRIAKAMKRIYAPKAKEA